MASPASNRADDPRQAPPDHKVDAVMSGGMGLDMPGQDRFADHLQAPDKRHMLGDTVMLMTEIIDKHAVTLGS